MTNLFKKKKNLKRGVGGVDESYKKVIKNFLKLNPVHIF